MNLGIFARFMGKNTTYRLRGMGGSTMDPRAVFGHWGPPAAPKIFFFRRLKSCKNEEFTWVLRKTRQNGYVAASKKYLWVHGGLPQSSEG